jgi:hypothetical protein
MIGPYETRLCEWCNQPVGECECGGGGWDDDDDDLGCPCGGGCWDDADLDDRPWTYRPTITIDTGGLT